MDNDLKCTYDLTTRIIHAQKYTAYETIRRKNIIDVYDRKVANKRSHFA